MTGLRRALKERGIFNSLTLTALTVSSLALAVIAQDIAIDPSKVALGKAEYSPYLDQGYPDRVYFGDTHNHTSYSTDAGMMGARIGPEEAYRFARGEEVMSSTGVRARLQRPLDFLVVADHSENLGLATMISESNPELLKTAFGRQVHDLVKSGKGGDAYNLWGDAMLKRQDPLKGNDAISRSMWERETSAAEKYNQPGRSPHHRLRMDVDSQRQQPAPQRDLPRWQGQSRPDHPFSQYDSVDPKISGRGWPRPRQRPAAASWRFRTTATCQAA
jgi:hypothetical protein